MRFVKAISRERFNQVPERLGFIFINFAFIDAAVNEFIFLLGVLVYTLIFPGIFILKFLPVKENKSYLLPLIPVSSMAFNGILYWIFYEAGIYNRTVLAASFLIYFLLFFLLFKPCKMNIKWRPGTLRISTNTIIGLCLLCVFVFYALRTLTTPFYAPDSVASWNHWGMQMGSSIHNTNDYYELAYPQLLPSIYSIIYKINIFDKSMYMNAGQYINHFYNIIFVIHDTYICYFSSGYDFNLLLYLSF